MHPGWPEANDKNLCLRRTQRHHGSDAFGWACPGNSRSAQADVLNAGVVPRPPYVIRIPARGKTPGNVLALCQHETSCATQPMLTSYRAPGNLAAPPALFHSTRPAIACYCLVSASQCNGSNTCGMQSGASRA